MSAQIRSIIQTILLLVLFRNLPSCGQTESEESLFDSQTGTVTLEDAERIDYMRMHPVDMNTADERRMIPLPFFTPVFAQSVCDERKKNGPFVNPEDFQIRMHLDDSFMAQISPYIASFRTIESPDISLHARSRFRQEYPNALGFSSGEYAGSPSYAMQKFNVDTGDLSGGLCIEKDPGESRWVDHASGFVGWKNSDESVRAILGNYDLQSGQGLVFSSPYGFYKGGDPVASVMKTADGLRSVSSSGENGSLFGGAAEIQTGWLELGLYLSRTYLDASLYSSGQVTGFLLSGLHRTAAEIKNRNVLRESSFGGRMRTSFNSGSVHGHIGFSGGWTKYGIGIHPRQSERRPFEFHGEENRVLGLNWECMSGVFHLSGEWAGTRSSGKAILVNGLMDLGKTACILSFRRYDPLFQNPRARGFGGGEANNEKGIYFGLIHRISNGTRFGFYADLNKMPARTYFLPVPSAGSDWMVETEHRFYRIASILLRIRFRDSEAAAQTDLGQDVVVKRLHRSVRIEIRSNPHPRIRVRNRIESVRVAYPEIGKAVTHSSEKENGILMMEDIRWEPTGTLSFSMRWMTFDTDSYDSRITTFDNNVPGTMSILSLYGKGSIWSILAQWRAISALSLNLQFANTVHTFADCWGTGNEQIPGNQEKRLTIQIEWILK